VVTQTPSTKNLYRTFDSQGTGTVAMNPNGSSFIRWERAHYWKRKKRERNGCLRICKAAASVRAYLIKGSGDDGRFGLMRPVKREGSDKLTGEQAEGGRGGLTT
jgi:hypothetical protein